MAGLTLAQIGCGYWGPNLLRSFSSAGDCRISWVVEKDSARREFVEKQFPGVDTTADLSRVLGDPSISGIVVATPAESHFDLAAKALKAGKHVFVEKPMATRVSEIDELSSIATGRRLVLMVGHTFLYNNAVRYVKDLIIKGDLGEIRYIYSQRLNLGRIRSDIDALWNFAPHDLSIIQFWLRDREPISVRRSGVDYMQTGIEDVVFLNLLYPDRIMANIHVSWLDPQKVRKTVVVGSRKMVVYDDMADDKVAIYDKGIDRVAKLGERMDFDAPGPLNFNYRSGDVLIPKILWTEPLKAEAAEFVDCIRSGREPLTGAKHARGVVSILERCSPQA